MISEKSFLDTGKLERMLRRLTALVRVLDDRNDLVIHRHVNQFYYMQKVEELRLLIGEIVEIRERCEVLVAIVETLYPEIYHCWKKDVRWLHIHLHKGSGSVNVLDHQ
jgi:hypothetical protein